MNPIELLNTKRGIASQAIMRDRSERTGYLVQIGQCSQSVGVQTILENMRENIPKDSYLVTAGCDGACHDAPKIVVVDSGGSKYTHARVESKELISIIENYKTNSQNDDSFLERQTRIALERCGEIDSTDINDYLINDGYNGLATALTMTPEEVITTVINSGLRGRGGAYFPAGQKWKGARSVKSKDRYLVVNCEEGEPGIFKDRHLMEGIPHRLIEGAIIASYASSVSEAFVYINAEAHLSTQRMQLAIDQARSQGFLGENILSSGFSLEMRILRGAGGYVCGEETTLINTIEGRRREPRLRPPFPTEQGLWSSPTVINNAETLANVPYVLSKGSDVFASVGTEDHKGTKIISLSGSVKKPGIVEVPMGTTLSKIIYDLGGGITDDRELSAVAVGGPSSGVLPNTMLDTSIRPGVIQEPGVMLVACGVIVLNDKIDVEKAVLTMAQYNADESCGKCTPCREGTPRLVSLATKILSKEATNSETEEAEQLAKLINATSLCGLGQAAGNPILSLMHFFKKEDS